VLLACLLVGAALQQPASADISSLHEAAKWGDLDAARRLLDAGGDVNGLVRRDGVAAGAGDCEGGRVEAWCERGGGGGWGWR
jgi:hypothetical protein